MPVLFVGNGNPMNAIEDNEFAMGWRAVGKEFPRPTAILCIQRALRRRFPLERGFSSGAAPSEQKVYLSCEGGLLPNVDLQILINLGDNDA